MPLDRNTRRILDMLRAGGAGAASEFALERVRGAMREFALALDPRDLPIGAVRDLHIDSPGGSLPVRLYVPEHSARQASAGLVWFHGGVGVFGGIDTHDAICRMLAADSAARVVSVDYRLAPEHPFPAALDDSWCATRWVADHAAELGIDADRLAVGGDSAGGTLAAVVCQRAHTDHVLRIAAQLLLCPVTDLCAATASRAEFAHGYFLSRELMEWGIGLYCPAGQDRADARLSPLRAPSFAGLPCTHVHTAEFDPLRDEGAAYAEALRAAGVEVHYTCHEGLAHHFYGMAGAVPAARAALQAAAQALRRSLARPQ